MNSADSFSAHYTEARLKFRDAAIAAGGVLEAMPHPENGPDGSALFTDIALFGPRDAEHMLVLLSGTHGVEGFCGSGAQVDLLRRGEATDLPAGVGVLMVHGINPYGFAWLRRVTHENIDLNRNWIDFEQPIPGNAGYDCLHEVICPPEWNIITKEEYVAGLAAYAAREGEPAMRQAVSGGQYRHPAGIFYGGSSPSWSRVTQTAVFDTYLSSARSVGIIDYHTGLGPWGYGERIITMPRNSEGYRRARAWYGASITSVADGTSASARIAGDGLTASVTLLPHAEVTAMALEMGTFPIEEMFLAVRADAWLHAHGDVSSPEGQAIKRQIRAVFYPDTDTWKGMVLGQSLLAYRQALAGLIGNI